MKFSQEADKIARIAAICGRDVGRGSLFAYATPGLATAAHSIAAHPKPEVAIITGFFIPDASPPAAETDGPLGAVHLAKGLIQAGIPARLITDAPCRNAVKSAASVAKLSIPVDVFSGDGEIPHWDRTTHLIAIERVGPGYDGVFRNMRAKDISTFTAPLDCLFLRTKAVTIAIGDGGNEIGMGNLSRESIAKVIDKGEKIACCTRCDHLIVCGVSNWGGIALLAAISLLCPDRPFLKSAQVEIDFERRVLEAMVKEGPAVDGVTGTQTLSVDGFPWEYHSRVLREILNVLKKTF